MYRSSYGPTVDGLQKPEVIAPGIWVAAPILPHTPTADEARLYATLDEAARQFTEAVFVPAVKAPRGLKRLAALFENWISWTHRAHLPGGCPVDAATREFNHQPGPMRDAALAWQKRLDDMNKALQPFAEVMKAQEQK